MLQDVNDDNAIEVIVRKGKPFLAISGNSIYRSKAAFYFSSHRIAQFDAVVILAVERLEFEMRTNASTDLEGSPSRQIWQVAKWIRMVEVLDDFKALWQYLVPMFHEAVGKRLLLGRQHR